MPQVHYRQTSDIRDVERDIAKLTRENARLTDQMRKLATEARKSQRENRRMYSGVSQIARRSIGDLKGMAMQFFAIQSGINLVVAGFRVWREEMRRLAAEQRKFTGSLVKDLTEAGDLAQGQRIQRDLENVPGVTRQQARQTFAGVTAAAPGAALDRRLALTREAAIARAATGVDLGDLGRVTGQLEKLAPGKGPGDSVDIATQIRAQAGGRIREAGSAAFIKSVESVAKTGAASLEEALGLGIAALEANLSPEVLVSVASKLTQKIQPPKAIRTDQDARKFLFSQMGPAGRLEALQESPAMAQAALGADIATRFSLLRPQIARQRAQQITAAQAEDFRRERPQFAAAQAQAAEQRIDVLKERRERVQQLVADQRERAMRFVEAHTANQLLRRMAIKTIAAVQPHAGGVLGVAERLGGITRSEMRQFAEEERPQTREIQREKARMRHEEVRRRFTQDADRQYLQSLGYETSSFSPSETKEIATAERQEKLMNQQLDVLREMAKKTMQPRQAQKPGVHLEN